MPGARHGDVVHTGSEYRVTYNSDTIHTLNGTGTNVHEQLRGWAWGIAAGTGGLSDTGFARDETAWLNAVNGNYFNDYTHYVNPGTFGNALGVVLDYDNDYSNYGCLNTSF